MKTPSSLRIILAALLLALLTGCAIFAPSGPQAVMGTWTNSLGTIWMIKSDGTFDVDLNHNGKRDAWGNYAVAGKTISIQGTGGIMPKGCKRAGVYRFTRGMDSLRFTLVHDNCKLRVKDVTRDWHRK